MRPGGPEIVANLGVSETGAKSATFTLIRLYARYQRQHVLMLQVARGYFREGVVEFLKHPVAAVSSPPTHANL